MRRFLSLVLLSAFGLPAIMPALGLAQDAQSSLPACCRRNGAHHCTGNMQHLPSSAPGFSERCPSFPQPSATPSKIDSFVLLSAPLLSIAQQASLVTHQPPAAQHQLASDFAHPKRGPPTVSLA